MHIFQYSETLRIVHIEFEFDSTLGSETEGDVNEKSINIPSRDCWEISGQEV